jgi:hypothetical protein
LPAAYDGAHRSSTYLLTDGLPSVYPALVDA